MCLVSHPGTMGHLKLLNLTITTVSGVSRNTLYHTCVCSCDFYIFNSKNRMASPDLSDFLAADVCWYEHQADVLVVFENTVRLGSGRRTRSSASAHTPASHPRPSSYSLLSSQSLCQTHITENYTLFLVYTTAFVNYLLVF